MRPLLVVALLSLVVAPAAAAAPASPSPAPASATSAPASATSAPASSALAPASTTSAPAVQSNGTSLSGTVTYLNGSAVADATVLVGSENRLGNASAEELRELAADPPESVATATTNDDGKYATNVSDDVDAEVVVAVSADGASRPRSYTAGEMNLTVRTTTTLTFESQTVTAEPSERVHVPFTLENTGDQPVEGLSLSLTLPEGWNHVSATSETGTFHEGNRTFTWDTVEPGETVEASFRIFVGLNAINDSARTYELATFADSNTHPVDASPAEVTVRYPTERTDAEVPGFGLPAALLAVVALAGVAIARRD